MYTILQGTELAKCYLISKSTNQYGKLTSAQDIELDIMSLLSPVSKPSTTVINNSFL